MQSTQWNSSSPLLELAGLKFQLVANTEYLVILHEICLLSESWKIQKYMVYIFYHTDLIEFNLFDKSCQCFDKYTLSRILGSFLLGLHWARVGRMNFVLILRIIVS